MVENVQMVNQKNVNDTIRLSEKAALNRILKNCRGMNLLQIGNLNCADYCDAARVLRTFFLSSDANLKSQQSTMQGYSDCLPIQSESIDILILLHELDQTKNPVEILKEARRVLRPNGQIIIIGFNRWSLWNIFHHKKKFHSYFLSSRIKRMLSMLDFEVSQRETFCFWPSNLLAETLGLFCLPYAGAIAMLVGTKYIPGLTPLIDHHFRGVRAPSTHQII